jgi:hypothetical protein
MNRFRILVTILLCTSAVQAGSLPFSRPGLIDIPTATVLQHTEIELGGSFTAFSYENADSISESDFAVAGHLEVGLFNRGQIGITWLGSAGLSGNARVIVIRESIKVPAIAVGCQNITGEKNYEFFRDSNDSLYTYEENQNFAAYIVLTKNLDYLSGIPMCINLGFGIGRFMQGKNADFDGISNPVRGLFGGIDYHPVRNVSLMLEWDGRDASIGAEYTLNSNVRFLFAASELEQLVISDRNQSDVMQNVKISIGAEFTLGPFLNRTTLEPFEELSQDYNEELLLELERLRLRAKEEIEEMKRDIP